MNTNTQKFPSGEVRVFEAEDGAPLALVAHTRAPGDPSKVDLVGTLMEDMPPPFDPDAE